MDRKNTTTIQRTKSMKSTQSIPDIRRTVLLLGMIWVMELKKRPRWSMLSMG
jgi:hypothetical protein